MTDDRVPNVLTVEEAAKVLRIGRTSAYQLAHRFEATGGEEGLPVFRLGEQLRVPVPELERRLGGPLRVTPSGLVAISDRSDEVPTPIEAVGEVSHQQPAVSTVVPIVEPIAPERRRSRNRSRSRDQLNLFVSEVSALADQPELDSSTAPRRRTHP
ncbi:MAG: helix-turn-helix domain-containing protein [Acidimicrobiales bacterium]